MTGIEAALGAGVRGEAGSSGVAPDVDCAPSARQPAARTERKARREILCDDVDRWGDDRRLWAEEAEPPARAALCAAVRDAVATALTDKQREVVEAYFFEGLSQGEIARRLGVAQQVVQKRLFGAARGGRLVGGAMLRLRKALEPAMAAAAGVSP